ncbi:serine/threonine protein kinase [Rubidibacter lacunae KORDI 51-2]|uniref:non-specific serine/threonine protein kinase n=1 Tax=Rubidibacter lacunae KORDI 51-2 TaxID=582515 RepID=U5DML3_9CHRO|nr:tetratricopeptide repeat protein [Rubidibacter lacunae]ERN41849.1 serine/threonine protein kinase [Rubidibacter lacunae KORDI 51-2]
MPTLKHFEDRDRVERPLGGRYRILRQLGRGGFGQTFLAEDLHLPDRPTCVVKQLNPQTEDEESLEIARRLFETEARVLYRLGTHSKIPRLLAHFEDEHEFYLVQEFVPGHPLSKELKTGHPWSEAAVVSFLLAALEPLTFVHEQGVIHRDLKPPNLMRRDRDGSIVLIDFGAVKQVSARSTETHIHTTGTVVVGTPGFMPSEQLAGKPRYSSDVFAVGIIAIQALTGVRPDEFPQHPDTGELEWHSHAPQLTPELGALLDRMVYYHFRDRYKTAREALTAVCTLPTNLLSAAAALAPVSNRKEAGIPEGGGLPSAIADEPAGVVEPGAVMGIARTVPEEAIAEPPITVSAADMMASPIQPAPRDIKPVKDSAAAPQQTVARSQTATLTAARNNSALSILKSTPFERRTAIGAATALGLVAIAAIGLLFGSSDSASQLADSDGTAPTNSSTAVVDPATEDKVDTTELDAPPAPQKPTPAELVTRADELRAREQYAEAIAQYDRAIAEGADSADAHWGRCYSLNQLQRFDTALSACNRALAIAPEDYRALSSKGFAFEKLKRAQDALIEYDRALDIAPDYALAWNNRGTALLALGRNSEALDAFDKAIALDLKFAESWSNRGVALWNLRRFPEALKSVETALELQPDHPAASTLHQQMQERL